MPDDVYKAHLVEGRAPAGRAMDSARQNLASTFVNGFVNAGFGHDKLMTKLEESDGSQVGKINMFTCREYCLISPMIILMN